MALKMMMYSKRIATKWKMKTVMKQQKVEIKIKMKKCLMTIMSNIHWGTENISLGNLRTRTMVRMNLKYSEALFNLCKFFFSFQLFPSIRGGHSISSSSKPLCSTSVFFAPTSSISSFTTSTNLLFGLVLLLFPGNSISIIFLPTYSWSLLMTCPYHLSLPSLIFIPNRSTLTVLVSNLVFSCHSHSKPQHFHLCNFHLFHLFLCDWHHLKFIHHCWSYH